MSYIVILPCLSTRILDLSVYVSGKPTSNPRGRLQAAGPCEFEPPSPGLMLEGSEEARDELETPTEDAPEAGRWKKTFGSCK